MIIIRLLLRLTLQQARDEEYLVHTLMTGMPALGERVQQIRVGKAATTAAENDKQLERSQVSTSSNLLLNYAVHDNTRLL